MARVASPLSSSLVSSSSFSPNSSLTIRTSWLAAAKTLAFAFTIAIPLLLVRRMPQHEFGLYKQIFLVIGSAIGVLPLGFGLTAFYFLPREERYRNHTVFNVVLFTTAVAALFAAALSLFPSVLILVFSDTAAARFAPWIAIIIVLWVVGSFLEIVTVANQEIKVATAAILAIQVTRATFFLIAAIASGTVRALVVAAIAQGVVQVGALAVYLHDRFPGFWRAWDSQFFRKQLSYALPFGVAGTLWTLQADLHNYFVSHQYGPAAYAVYAIGCFQVPLFGILAESVGSVMIPRVSFLQHEQQTREIILLTARVMRKLAAIYLPAYVFLLVMRHEFIVGLFTDRYLGSIPVFAVNLTLIPLGVFVVDPVMRAYAEHRHFLVKLHAILLVGLTVALALCIGRFGLIGAITLMVVFTYIGRAATVVKVVRILGVQAHDVVLYADVVKIGGAAAVAGLVTAILRPLTSGLPPLLALASGAVCFGIVYVAATLAAGVVTPEERAVVLSSLRRVTGRPGLPVAEPQL
jgi:O-antigen/teichoic acid export membrane protein